MTLKLDQYEERFIAFIDILAFKEHVNQTITNPEHFKKVRDILNFISKLKDNNDHGYFSQKEFGREVTVFSDSIVISYPISFSSAGFHLFMDVIHLQLEMMKLGILMRGGITKGLLSHEDNIVFGPAMIEAYNLENEHANYPRVIVEESTIEEAALNGNHSPLEEIKYIETLLEQDSDGYYFVDFLTQWQEVDVTDDYFTGLDITKNIIERAINDHSQNERVLEKYQWLKIYYNNTLNKLNAEYSKGRYIP